MKLSEMSPALVSRIYELSKQFAVEELQCDPTTYERVWKRFNQTGMQRGETTRSVQELPPEIRSAARGIVAIVEVAHSLSIRFGISPQRMRELILDEARKARMTDEERTKLLRFFLLIMSTERVVEPTTYARMWTNSSPLEGDSIPTRKAYDDLFKEHENNLCKWPIFIIDPTKKERRRVGRVYFDGRPAFRIQDSPGPYLTPIEYCLLVYLLRNKNRGDGVTIENLVQNCFRKGKKGVRVLNEQTKSVDYHEEAGKYRNTIAELSHKLETLDTCYKTLGTGYYELHPWIEFCVIQAVEG